MTIRTTAGNHSVGFVFTDLIHVCIGWGIKL